MLVQVVIFAVTIGVFQAGAKVVRPCALHDLKCIGDNFSANSKCSRNLAAPVGSVHHIGTFAFETPYFNSSYIDRSLVLRNQNNCFVSEFFFNIKTDTSVLSIDCPNLDLQSKRTLIRHQSKREDEYFHFNYRAVYPLVRLTMNIKHADTMPVCSSYTFADVTTLPNFIVDPTDKPTQNFLSTDLSFMNIYERENFSFRAGPIMRDFINSNICNYNC